MSEQLTVAYDRKQLILDRSAMSEELEGKYAELYHFADGRLQVRSKGIVLPYRIFDKDQLVSPAAMIENKRLGHALSRIKAQQDARVAPATISLCSNTVYWAQVSLLCQVEMSERHGLNDDE